MIYDIYISSSLRDFLYIVNRHVYEIIFLLEIKIIIFILKFIKYHFFFLNFKMNIKDFESINISLKRERKNYSIS